MAMTSRAWTTQGFEGFRVGTCGNAGQNLYVSRAGVLQRIYCYDLNRDGHAELIFANSHDFVERPPMLVVSGLFSARQTMELLTDGSHAGAVADLNGDGYDDLIVAGQDNGTHRDLAARVYYGGPDGFSEMHHVELPAPDCRSVAVGDFDGDGQREVAFLLSEQRVRIYRQGPMGFLINPSAEFPLACTYLSAGDLDGDGYDELIVRMMDRRPRVLWGGPAGIDADRFTEFGEEFDESALQWQFLGGNCLGITEGSRPKALTIGGRRFLFHATPNEARLLPVNADRTFGEMLRFRCKCAVSAAAGDFNGDGQEDVVIAARDTHDGATVSWVYWGGTDGFSESRRTPLPSPGVRDVAVDDLDGDGCDDIAFCLGRDEWRFTTESVVYRGGRDGVAAEPVRFVTHDASDVGIARAPDRAPQVVFINHQRSERSCRVPIYVYLGGADGYDPQRRLELPGFSASEVLPCDFNDDGWPDLLVLNDAEDIPHVDEPSYLYWGGPSGFDPKRRGDVPTHGPWGGVVADLDRDGYLDLVVGGMTWPPRRWRDVHWPGMDYPDIYIYCGTAEGFDTRSPQVLPLRLGLRDCTHGVRWPLLADFNNDGFLDLFVPVCGAAECPLFWGGPDGFHPDRRIMIPVHTAVSARAADLDGDGWPELIIGQCSDPRRQFPFSSNLLIFWGGPNGFSPARCTTLPAYHTNTIAIADFNGDGVPDIFAGFYLNARERDLDSVIYWGGPRGHYSPRNTTRLFCHSASGSFAADLDDDGRVDLVVAQHRAYGSHQAASVIWWNKPDGFSPSHRTWLPTIGPHGMCSVPPRNLVTGGDEEHYESGAFELPSGARIHRITWVAELPPQTWVRAQFRSARSRAALAASAWGGPDGTTQTWFASGDAADALTMDGSWIQYRLALGARNGGGTPRITRVDVEYG